MTPDEQATRGERAQTLLENPVLAEALDAIEAAVIQQWETCPAMDKEGKEAFWQLYKTSKRFRALLLGYVQTGKLASENIKRHKEHGRLRSLLSRVA